MTTTISREIHLYVFSITNTELNGSPAHAVKYAIEVNGVRGVEDTTVLLPGDTLRLRHRFTIDTHDGVPELGVLKSGPNG